MIGLDRLSLCVVVGGLVIAAGLALADDPPAASGAEPPAQPNPDPPDEADNKTNEQTDEKGSEPLESLDDLLGLPTSDAPASGAGDELPLADPVDRELDRTLSGEQIGQAFEQAVTLMGETADRLGTGHDYGLTTQRLQEDILRKLDQIIASAGQGGSGSSSSSSNESNAPQNQPDQQQQQSQASKGGESTQGGTPPARQDGALNPLAVSQQAAWGALPARVRDALLQGTSDPFSVLYRSMTESYYRRLAEEDRR